MELEVPQILPALSFIARYFGLDPSTQDFPIVIKQNRKTVSCSLFQWILIENIRRILLLSTAYQRRTWIHEIHKGPVLPDNIEKCTIIAAFDKTSTSYREEPQRDNHILTIGSDWRE